MMLPLLRFAISLSGVPSPDFLTRETTPSRMKKNERVILPSSMITSPSLSVRAFPAFEKSFCGARARPTRGR